MKHFLLAGFLAALASACIIPTNGQVVHFDLPAKDPDKLGTFYKDLYGWEITKWDDVGDPYWLANAPRGGMFMPGIDGGIYRPKDGDPEVGVSIYVSVDDVDAYLEKAKSLGAEVVVPKMAIPKVGFIAHIKDPEGNVTGLFQYDPGKALEAWEAEQKAKE